MAKITPKEPNVPEVQTRQAPPPTLGEIMKQVEGAQNPFERVFSEMGARLFDSSQILKISRLTKDLQFHVIKLLTIKLWFAGYWMRIHHEAKLVASDAPPYYRLLVHDVADEDHKAKMIASYPLWITEILETTISLDGKSREEILNAMGGAASRIHEEERNSLNGAVRRS
jgi:hypothetical protein